MQPFLRRPKENSLGRIVVALLSLVLAGCNTTPVPRNEPQPANGAPVIASDAQKPSADSPMEFLLTSAAADFHAHRPPVVTRFRNVRFGHVMTPAGDKQYLLCGEFLPQQQEGNAQWTPFVTIKTSGYEQWIGGQAATWCQTSRVVWDHEGYLSSSLQKRHNSLDE
jgi:hypothetical protein